MAKKVFIYGKETCPYTKRALEIYVRRGFTVEYTDVVQDRASLEEMLVHTGGKRLVPVILEGETLSIGFGGT